MMNFFRQNNNLLMGILLGATIPVIGYMGIEILFESLTDIGFMDELTESTVTKRKRTMALIALCFNILTVQFFKGRQFSRILNGIVSATLLYAVGWILIFKIL